jgi:hypothetical protein
LIAKAILTGMGAEEHAHTHTYLAESVYSVVLQKSISTQIRQLVVYITNIKNKLTDLCG